MKKILKILSLLLIVPVLGITSLLTGCGKETATLAQVEAVYDSIVSSNTEGDANIFATDGKFEFALGSLVYTGDALAPTEKNLRQQYVQLTNVYLELLNQSNEYFLKYKESFFGSNVEMDGEELNNLKIKATNLKNEIASFKTELNSRKEIAAFITSDTQVMATKLKTLNYNYINLINTNFDFVLTFSDMHNKYVLKDQDINPDTAERIAYEAKLKYVYGYFLDYVKSFQHNNLADTLPLTSTSGVFNRENPVYGTSDLGEKVIQNLTFNLGINWSTQYENTELAPISEAKETKVENLIKEVERFDVFLNVYKNVYNEFDMYTYNQVRENYNETLYAQGTDAMTNFVNSLSSQDKAYHQLISNFTNYDMVNLESVLNNILV